MSKRGDRDYKPNSTQLKGKRIPSKERPVRSTRSKKEYNETVVITDAEEEISSSGTEGEVGEGYLSRYPGRSKAYTWDSTNASVGSVKSEDCWSPHTIAKKTDNILINLSELQTQLTQAQMAQQKETSLADIMQQMLRMQTENDNRAREREEKREEERLVREEESKRERLRWEYEMKRDRDERETKILLALKEAQPAVPQTVHIENVKFPKMKEGEDVEVFVELFEAAMRDGNIPEDRWKSKIHAALDTTAKLLVRDVITNQDSTYDKVKQALVGHGHLTFTASSEALMTQDGGATCKLPMRQAIQKTTRLLEKATAEATTMRETCQYIAIAVNRFFLSPDLKQYVDLKGTFDKDGFCRSVEEWQRTHPYKQTWDSRRTVTQDRQLHKPAMGRKQGSCYHCGKMGHFAYECRTKLAGDKPVSQATEQTQTVGKRELVQSNKQERDVSEVTCFRCRKKGHISPNCPLKTNRVKRIKIPENKCVALRKNEVFGAIGGYCLPVTCDTGAEVTVVPAECVSPHQLTGQVCELKAFNETKSIGQWCNVEIVVGDTMFSRKAVTQPGATLGWSACLSLDMADEREGQFLLEKMRERAAMTEEETYLPPEVREGNLMSGVLAKDAVVVKSQKLSVPSESGTVVTKEEVKEVVPVRSTEVEAQSREITNDEIVSGEVEGDQKESEMILEEERKDLVLDEGDGGASGGSASEKGSVDLSVEAIKSEIPRTDLALATEKDQSLAAVLNLGLQDKEGYHVVEGLLFRTRLDMFGDPVEQLCMPASYRGMCLETAHNSFGHQGRNKMMLLLRPHFYWPNMSRDCQKHVRACERCQKLDKATPRPNTMTERQIVTQPFQDIAIDIVGPFPTAVGGFRYLLTCVDNATRWPEAVPLRSTTARVVISSLTDIFVRCGFPSRLTSDNGSQFTGKTFSNWLKAKGIQHTKTTPYHPQGNGIIERLHRTLNAIVAKTASAKGNWAKVVPMALYFLRCTPSASTGISPFLATHGWEPVTPLQVLYQSWVQSDLGGIDLTEWV